MDASTSFRVRCNQSTFSFSFSYPFTYLVMLWHTAAKGCGRCERNYFHSYCKYSGLHDQYHLFNLAQDCLFVRLRMFNHSCVGEKNPVTSSSITKLGWHLLYICVLLDNELFFYFHCVNGCLTLLLIFM